MTQNQNENLVPKAASEELAESFLEYSMSVVYSRAIPSVEDGLKPVQRRILYGMYDAGWTSEKNYVKVSRIAGEIMGKYHPHGDSSISDALVKIGQPFYSQVPFVDSYGNWGDVSGSSPAAARYIEGKLSKAAEYILREIKENSVDMRDNYDGTTEEPVLLPAMFPVLLVNGNFGIGVGFSSRCAPHNLAESIDATKALLRKPDADLDHIMRYIPGPDFPTGAEIIGTDGIRQAYETGQGVIRLRAKVEVKPTTRGKHELIFTELPYGVKTETIITKIKALLKEGKLAGLADARDLTDRKNGLRVVIESKAGANPQALLAELYKDTPLEDSFGINFTVLVKGEPRVVTLVEMLQLFIEFRREVVTRRSQFRMQKRQERLHILDGLLKALANIDAVIKIVRGAEDAAAAQTGLMTKFKIDDVQADYILSIPLRRLTRYDSIQLENERDRLVKEIAELEEILSNPEALKKVMLKELDEVKKALAEPRKSVIVGGTLAEHLEEAKQVVATVSAEVEDAPCFVAVHASGAVTRSAQPVTVGGRGKIDPIVATLQATTRSNVVLVSNRGVGYRLEAVHIGEDMKNTAKDLGLALGTGERLVAVARNEAQEGEAGLALGTKNGVVKVSTTDFPLRSDTFPVISLADGDEVVAGGWVADPANTDFVFISSDSSVLRFEAARVRPQGSKGGGMAGIKLAAGQRVLAFAVVAGDERELAEFVTYTGMTLKRSALSQVPTKGRATGGVRGHAYRKGETEVKVAGVAVNPIAVDSSGKNVTLPAASKRDSSGTPETAEVALVGRKG